MGNNFEDIFAKIKKLQNELDQEIQKKEEEFFYKIRGKRVYFEKEIKRHHKIFVKGLYRYFFDAPLLNILTVPVIWSCIMPAVFMDLVVTVYHAACFRMETSYGIVSIAANRGSWSGSRMSAASFTLSRLS